MAKSKGPKVYAVARGRVPGIYATWSECQAQTKGFSGAIFKSFKTRHEAESFMQINNNSSSKSSSAASVPSGNNRGEKKRPPENDAHSNHRKKTSNQKEQSSNSNFQLQIKIHFDGGSRGNPGVAGAGAEVVVVDNCKSTQATTTYSVRKFCGNRETNNFAEYNGLLVGLKRAKSCIEQYSSNHSAQSSNPLFQLQIYGDSNLIIQQLKGAWQCRNANIKPLFQQCQQVISEMKHLDAKSEVLLEHVYREQNKVADALANEAMDRRQSWTTSTADSSIDDSSNDSRMATTAEIKKNNNGIAAPSDGGVIDLDGCDDDNNNGAILNFMLQLTIHFDGGSRGNPGVAGAGAQVVVVDNSKSTQATTTYSIRKFCGDRETNNYAEYNGLLAGLKQAKSCIEQYLSKQSAQPSFQLQIFGDSNLIIQQLKGAWQCKNANIKPLFRQSQQLISEMKDLAAKNEVLLEHVYREHNKAADALANEAMDKRQSWTTSTADSPDGNEKSETDTTKRNHQNAAPYPEQEVIDVDGDETDNGSHLSC